VESFLLLPCSFFHYTQEIEKEEEGWERDSDEAVNKHLIVLGVLSLLAYPLYYSLLGGSVRRNQTLVCITVFPPPTSEPR